MEAAAADSTTTSTSTPHAAVLEETLQVKLERISKGAAVKELKKFLVTNRVFKLPVVNQPVYQSMLCELVDHDTLVSHGL